MLVVFPRMSVTDKNNYFNSPWVPKLCATDSRGIHISPSTHNEMYLLFGPEHLECYYFDATGWTTQRPRVLTSAFPLVTLTTYVRCGPILEINWKKFKLQRGSFIVCLGDCNPEVQIQRSRGVGGLWRLKLWRLQVHPGEEIGLFLGPTHK